MIRNYEILQGRHAVEASQAEDAKRKVQEIAAHPETVIVRREQMPGPWEYVESLFPRIAPVVSETIIYKNENTAFCRNIGVPAEAAGLFFVNASAILLCWNDSKFKDDVIICHEMLHYASRLLGGRMESVAVEEDFAYMKSIRYLNSQGYSDAWIAGEYMLPYYMGREWSKDRSDKEQAKARALSLCEKMVSAELYESEVKIEEKDDRFDEI